MLREIVFLVMLPSAGYAQWECHLAETTISVDIANNKFAEDGGEWQPFGFASSEWLQDVPTDEIIFLGQEIERPYRTFAILEDDESRIRLVIDKDSTNEDDLTSYCSPFASTVLEIE